MPTQSTYLIPNGPANLSGLFSINWLNVKDFFIEVLDEDDAVIATSPLNTVCNCPEGLVIHFLNYMGTFDTATFLKPVIIHEDSADEFIKGLSHPLSKTETGSERFNVRANDTYEAVRKCTEAEMKWLQELADSPKAFLQWKGIEGQLSSYIPIVKLAGKFEKLKTVREYQYDFVIQFRLSNEILTIRN